MIVISKVSELSDTFSYARRHRSAERGAARQRASLNASQDRAAVFALAACRAFVARRRRRHIRKYIAIVPVGVGRYHHAFDKVHFFM